MSDRKATMEDALIHPAPLAMSCYRRRVVVLVEPGGARAGVEDDYHHFHIALTHDGRKVTAIRGEAIRFPWRTCPGASGALQGLVGASIETAAVRRASAFDRFNQCTHQLELALLAIAQVARGASRRFDVTVGSPDEDGIRLAEVLRDGDLVERWRLAGDEIRDTPELAGLDVRKLRPWIETLDDERFEQIAVLRRCLQVSAGRRRTISPRIAAQVRGARNACYAFQDERAHLGHFIPESPRDFSASPDALLREFP